MRYFKGMVGVGLVNCRVPFEFEVEDDATDFEIEAVAFEAAMQDIEWHFNEVEE